MVDKVTAPASQAKIGGTVGKIVKRGSPHVMLIHPYTKPRVPAVQLDVTGVQAKIDAKLEQALRVVVYLH